MIGALEYIVEKSKRLIKELLPFEIRYRIQLYMAKHPEVKFFFLKRKRLPDEYVKFFYDLQDYMGGYCFENKIVCELGPGKYLYNAFLAYQMGAKEIYMIDIDDFAESWKKPKDYQYSTIKLRENIKAKHGCPRIDYETALREQLIKINAHYYTNGLRAYQNIGNESVDFIYSNTVLQHIRKKEFEQTISEMSRIIKAGGMMFHSVDLKDMMGGEKRHLEIPETQWEDTIHYRMDCYTNRLQCNEICELLTNYGFEIIELKRNYFKKNPVKNYEHIEIEDEELMTASFKIICRKKQHPIC